ncbi:hypothetical protein M0802_001024 [Mischocyttarus mexicanus]|nr:hypothetical protein M0802_001024 [Mischocyttarus mexicanus]
MPAGRQASKQASKQAGNQPENASVRSSFRLIGRFWFYEVSVEALRQREDENEDDWMPTPWSLKSLGNQEEPSTSLTSNTLVIPGGGRAAHGHELDEPRYYSYIVLNPVRCCWCWLLVRWCCDGGGSDDGGGAWITQCRLLESLKESLIRGEVISCLSAKAARMKGTDNVQQRAIHHSSLV